MNKFVDSYVIFDTETTGLKDQFDQIIEIGALKYIDNEYAHFKSSDYGCRQMGAL